MKKKILFVVGALAIFALGYFASNLAPVQKLSVTYPSTSDVSNNTNFTCVIKLDSFISPDATANNEAEKIVAGLSSSNEFLTIKLNDDGQTASLLFSSESSGGQTEGVVYTLMLNNDESLIAARQDATDAHLTTLVINKTSGIGYYNSTFADFMFNSPTSMTAVLSCV